LAGNPARLYLVRGLCGITGGGSPVHLLRRSESLSFLRFRADRSMGYILYSKGRAMAQTQSP
jgi:hypothetical protein